MSKSHGRYIEECGYIRQHNNDVNYKDSEQVAKDSVAYSVAMVNACKDIYNIADKAFTELSNYSKASELYGFPKVVRNCMTSLSECRSKIVFFAKSKDIDLTSD